ncbi:MAG: hypothetical protein SGI84_05980 [Gemmatimonadota bacterium]|nr:hypothetical protein [Gemmatimonadota bacterium]
MAAQADAKVGEILRAAASWSREAPAALTPAIRAVCVRLAEMVADQRHYLAPLPEPQESERRAVLSQVAERMRSAQVTTEISQHLKSLADLELRATGSWSLVASAQADWITTAIQYLEDAAAALPEGERPDPYWADDVVGGVIVSVKAIIGADDLLARTEAQYPEGRRASGNEDMID